MIKVIAFDFDGVLVESVDIKTNAFARLFEPEGKDVVRQVVDFHVKNTGVSRFDKFRYYYDTILKRKLSEDEFDALCRRFSELVIDEVVGAPYVKGAREFLDSYCASYKCFVTSATPQSEIEDIVERRGMERYFKGIYGAPKKKEDSVNDILKNEKISSQELLYVGDAKSDYQAALVNKTHFIARISAGEDIFKGIDCVKIGDLTGLKASIDRIGGYAGG